jgi:hypothetical protein
LQRTDLAQGEPLGDREKGKFSITTERVCSTADESNCDPQIFSNLSKEDCRNDNYSYLIISFKDEHIRYNQGLFNKRAPILP